MHVTQTSFLSSKTRRINFQFLIVVTRHDLNAEQIFSHIVMCEKIVYLDISQKIYGLICDSLQISLPTNLVSEQAKAGMGMLRLHLHNFFTHGTMPKDRRPDTAKRRCAPFMLQRPILTNYRFYAYSFNDNIVIFKALYLSS